MRYSNDTIGNQFHDLLVCSAGFVMSMIDEGMSVEHWWNYADGGN
jgi:hypothetical protein